MSIRTRITLFGLAVVLAVLTCFSGATFGLIGSGLPAGQDKRLAARNRVALSAIQQAPAGSFNPSTPLAPVRPAVDDDVFVVVLDAGGDPISYTGGTNPTLPPALLARALATGSATATVPLDGVAVRVVVQPWQRLDLGRTGYVVSAQPVRRQLTDLRGTLVVLVISAVFTLAAAAVAIWLVTGRALRPLRQLAVTADEIGGSADVTRRLPAVPRKDDLGRLTVSFNAMLDRLEAAHRRTAATLAGQQRFAADASHELRTPLTTIRNNAGFLRARPDAAAADRAAAIADIEAEAVRMSRLVDDLLTLARADGGAPLTLSTVDVGALAHEICRKAGAQHPDRTFHCAGPPTVLRADADALTQLLWILLDNAVRHTDPDGNIWVAVTSSPPATTDGPSPPATGSLALPPAAGSLASPPAAGRESPPTAPPPIATIQVADDGAGIPPGEESRIFARFHQADPARQHGGAGLGLSIAVWIVSAHRGSITAANNDRGGATFTVRISSIS